MAGTRVGPSKKRKQPVKEGTDADADAAPTTPVARVGPARPGVGPARPLKKQRKKKTLQFEKLYLDLLPEAQMYEKSYMHRSVITHTLVTSTDFIITGSDDGHIKFWKKGSEGISFVKHFRGHVEAIVSMACSADGLYLASASVDKTVKVYDVVNFDMINMFELDYVPSAVEWIFKSGTARPVFACTDSESPSIRIYDAKNTDNTCMVTLDSVHGAPVSLIAYNSVHHAVVSIDSKGMVEYWSADTYQQPKKGDGGVMFEFKTQTDLYEFAKSQTIPTSLSFSRDGKMFVCSARDQFVRVFKYASGKMYRKYDETIARFQERQADETSPSHLENIDFGRRMAVERELSGTADAPPSNSIFDESCNFILYPTLLGVKVFNLITNKLVRVIGKVENTERFLHIALYQGRVTGTAAMGDKNDNAAQDPTLICTAFKKHRFYLFTRREPSDVRESDMMASGRDVFNEKPNAAERAAVAKPAAAMEGAGVVIHTTMGDIHLKLYPEQCPRTVENFTTHSKNGYYDNVIFHRVIKGFMCQTGDPLGDGTGGSSIWGKDFEDEFHADLKHDRPFTLSMANAGANTNGSQFFITTKAIPRLDGKHTVFGRVVKGMDVVLAIENQPTDHTDKPKTEIRIMNVDII
eukprot:TRINITY_DN6243_c0_g1_i1.p1 TRINITY_DN6243_c0_g1~~TRINITY_DN6243_c0_g1_i1.p1  ORF type:complete len:636 (+),score=170.85 TRINITY_DN6243_c0_g1_i1:96-2003(+)